jgi:hypothetical protein
MALVRCDCREFGQKDQLQERIHMPDLVVRDSSAVWDAAVKTMFAWHCSPPNQVEWRMDSSSNMEEPTWYLLKKKGDSLDLFINEKCEVRNLKDICIGLDHSVHFDGEGVDMPAVCSISGDSVVREMTAMLIRYVALDARAMACQSRCFVKVVQGLNFTASHPFVICRVPSQPDSSHRVDLKARSLEPVQHESWDLGSFEFNHALTFTVMDCEESCGDRFLGQATINGDILTSTQTYPLTVKVPLIASQGLQSKVVPGSVEVQVLITNSRKEVGMFSFAR